MERKGEDAGEEEQEEWKADQKHSSGPAAAEDKHDPELQAESKGGAAEEIDPQSKTDKAWVDVNSISLSNNKILGMAIQAEGKRDLTYWDGSEGMLKRATAFIYRKIIAPKDEGGMREFFEDNCAVFAGTKGDDDHKLEYIPLYRQYEQLIDKALADFAKEEGFDNEELAQIVRNAMAANPTGSAEKSVRMLVAAGDYKKFVKMMRQRANQPKPRCY